MVDKNNEFQNIEVVKEPLPVYETWLEYFKRHSHLTDREKNAFIDNMVCLNTPIIFYSPNKFCNCFELKPGMAIHTKDDMKTCAKCNKPVRML